jgi:heme o synthase
MQLQETKVKIRPRGGFKDYLRVLKPRETGLLVFIGIVTAFLAGSGSLVPGKLWFILLTLLVASAGANGMTNYLDRDIDSRMERTRLRALPAGRINPPEMVLYLTAGLITGGLMMAWYLHPLVFAVDIIGTLASLIYRKRVTCVFPQGIIASCTPVLMGWLAVASTLNWEILFLCVLISVWLPSHIWSIMIAHKGEYLNAGINYFPVNRNVKSVGRILFGFCLLLYAASLGLYWVGDFGLLYLAGANLLGLLVVYSGVRLWFSAISQNAWRLYKISAFPYLGAIFLLMALDIWFHF